MDGQAHIHGGAARRFTNAEADDPAIFGHAHGADADRRSWSAMPDPCAEAMVLR